MKMGGAGISEISCRDGENGEVKRFYAIEWEFEKIGNNEINETLINAKGRGEYID
jgi:hypothetical protein